MKEGGWESFNLTGESTCLEKMTKGEATKRGSEKVFLEAL